MSRKVRGLVLVQILGVRGFVVAAREVTTERTGSYALSRGRKSGLGLGYWEGLKRRDEGESV